MTLKPKHRNVIAACARWETDAIVEWLAFQRYIGFDHVYLYCNDDDPHELYEAVLPYVYGPHPFVTFYHFGFQGQQEQMYFHFLKNHGKDCEWFSLIDIDEFILLRNHNNINEFIDSCPSNVEAIHFWSVSAGHNGHKTRPSGYVLRNFTKRSNKSSMFTKVIARSSALDYEKIKVAATSAFWHNISAVLKDDSVIEDTLGNRMNEFYSGGHLDNWLNISSKDNFHQEVTGGAFLYHIAMKSEEDLIRRYNRGVGGQFYGQSAWGDLYSRGPEQISAFLDQHNVSSEYRLLEQWEQLCSGALDNQIVAAPKGVNLALKCRAMQSSVSMWSSSQNPVEDASAVVNGYLNARPAHHTNTEEMPWWVVDLGDRRAISRIHFYNRCDGLRDRLRNFDILGSDDSENFKLIYQKNDSAPFGGADGEPYILAFESPVYFRYIKIVGHGNSLLDFSQIEIY